MNITQLSLIACLGLVSFAYFILSKPRSRLFRLRGPPSNSWLYGNMRELILGEFGIALLNWQKLYGPAFRFMSCFGEPRLMLSDPRALQIVLDDNYSFPRSVEQREVVRLLTGEGIFWAEMDDHKRHRAVMQPCFATGLIKQLLPRFIDTARVLVGRWEAMLNEETSSNVINVAPWIHRGTLDLIGSAAFNYTINSLVDDNNEVAQSYYNLLGDTMTRTPFSIIADGCLRYTPTFIIRSADYLPTKVMRRVQQNRRLINDLAKKHVQAGLDDIRNGVESKRDVLSQIVKANLETNKGVRMSLREVYAQVFSIMIAGEETVASTIIWALYELARAPEHQDRIRAEVFATMETVQARGDNEISDGDLDKMTFTVAFMKEVLRFHPILPISFREASKDVTLSLAHPATTMSGEAIGEIKVLKGEVVIINISGYNQLESIWGPDANEFRPSRWLDGSKGPQALYTGMYANLLTFLGGPRGCLGWRFALMEFQVFLIELVRKFRFAIPKDVKIRKEIAAVAIPVVVGDETRSARLPLEVNLIDA